MKNSGKCRKTKSKYHRVVKQYRRCESAGNQRETALASELQHGLTPQNDISQEHVVFKFQDGQIFELCSECSAKFIEETSNKESD